MGIPETKRHWATRGPTIALFAAISALLLSYLSCGDDESEAPKLPLKVYYRYGLDGIVVGIKNHGATPISFWAVCYPKRKGFFGRRDEHASKDYKVFLDPGEYKEIGWAEGWRFEPGELLLLYAEGYQISKHEITHPTTRL